MIIAVSGATGFIGRHVVDELLRRGHRPVLLLRKGGRSFTDERGLPAIELDVRDTSAGAFERMGRPSTLIHLAWQGLPNYRSPTHFEDELPAQYRFLKELIGEGLRNLVVSGTCFEYGFESGELAEELVPQPTNSYGYAKDALRKQLKFLQESTPFSLTWARLFYLYGPGQSSSSLWAQLQAAVRAGQAAFDMSAGEQLRDYMPVEDAARGLVDLALSELSHDVVNVCSGRPISVRRLVEAWIADHGWSIVPNLGKYPYPDYEPLAFWGDPRKMQKCLLVKR